MGNGPTTRSRNSICGSACRSRSGGIITDSADVIEVDEDGNPPRYYFPRSEVKMTKLTRTATTTQCPFKGTASYFTVNADSQQLDDVVWTYEAPYQEHVDLQGRVAFWDEKSPEIRIRKI